MYIYQINIVPKWQIINEPNYFISNDSKVYNLKTGKKLLQNNISESTAILKAIELAISIIESNPKNLFSDIIDIINKEDFGQGSFNRDEYKARILEKIVLRWQKEIN